MFVFVMCGGFVVSPSTAQYIGQISPKSGANVWYKCVAFICRCPTGITGFLRAVVSEKWTWKNICLLGSFENGIV